MTNLKSPFIKILLVLVSLVMLYFLPTREFLKITFFMGIPFIFIYGFMGKQRSYSFLWITSTVLLVGVLAAYGYLLVHLPERIATREIISEGGALVAEGKYDLAIQKYQKLEEYDQQEKMQEKISAAEREKQAQQQLDLAKQYLAAGDKNKAREIIKSIPPSTRAAVKARKLRSELGL